MAVPTEQCPVNKGTWGERGECSLIGDKGKVRVSDSSCTLADQADFKELHVKADLIGPKVVIETEGPLRQQADQQARIDASGCPLVNSGTCDIARDARNGIYGVVFTVPNSYFLPPS